VHKGQNCVELVVPCLAYRCAGLVDSLQRLPHISCSRDPYVCLDRYHMSDSKVISIRETRAKTGNVPWTVSSTSSSAGSPPPRALNGTPGSLFSLKPNISQGQSLIERQSSPCLCLLTPLAGSTSSEHSDRSSLSTLHEVQTMPVLC